MKDIEKFKKLEEVKKELKNQFVGLDDIIDKIIKSITPWYVTQDILERPTIVSLWGMTGTGKTSVVKKLIDLLELNERTISFDCGRETDGSTYGDSLSDKISDLMGDTDESVNENTKDFIFIFDEFQYAKTIDEDFNEISKPSLRPIWNIIDDGFVPVYEGRYSMNIFQEFLEDALLFEKENPDVEIHLKDGVVTDPKEIEIISKSPLGLFHFSPETFSLEGSCSKEVEETKKCNLNHILTPYILKKIFKKLNSKEVGLGNKIVDKIKSVKTLTELLRILESIRKDILSPKKLNCSRSLVFIIGNLDEAFKVHDEIDHDGDADTFYEITNNVSLTDIKLALRKRFRVEQISRLGNNLIKYPTLKKKHFEEIIDKELSRIFSVFKEKTGIKVSCELGIKELLYSEGVCPVQGVRPVFTTIGMIITPILSDILVKCNEMDCKEATISLNDINDWKIKEFRLPELYLKIIIGESILTQKIKLQIGELRSPENRKTRYACGIHEAGHALAMISCTGEYPIQVIAVDTNKGGSCYSFQKDRHNEIRTRKDYENDIFISLGGYIAEKVIFGNNVSQLLMGSNSDLNSIWDNITEAVFSNGYFGPVMYSDHSVESSNGIPSGIDIKTTNIIVGDTITTVYDAIKNKLTEKSSQVTTLLKREKKLLAHLGKYLGDNGSISKGKLISLVKEYATPELHKDIETSKKELDYSYYYNSIIRIIEE